MKTPKTTSERCVIAICSEDKKGLLGQILVLFNKRSYEVSSLNVSRTDINELVMITVEAVLPVNELPLLLARLQKIVEVYRAAGYLAGEANLDKVGFFRLSRAIDESLFWSVLQKYGAVISRLSKDEVVIRKTGSDRDLFELYGKLDGPHLLGFCKSGLIAEESLSLLNT
ncbi:ACT domain-containing protein [Mucilaginibacter sp. L3T2-6]|uniref:ACT domain-containing protein n=1 Tax=Mucilaginibacter sp. L3T2-6 TaxID=3062491 RepID=UPI0026762A2B|nr:ACT domain-containing protein [Mucilaginibacter sp. L3T2-6]MDO3644859.1 ACT domain-containing protein [Mucilaginibacter sp. L3T2-6]MDV6217247.1 ACT domain-containing protein [Mucilaginibacter sp. L3T2-6]